MFCNRDFFYILAFLTATVCILQPIISLSFDTTLNDRSDIKTTRQSMSERHGLNASMVHSL